jgi:Predicted deacetylase
MKIAVRMDDITPAMDWGKFEQFRALLDEYGIQPLIGVVPDNLDGNLNRGREEAGFWEYVKGLKEAGWVVALHGYQHIYTEKKGGMFPLNDFSEFAGVPYVRQREMLEKGKAILESHGIVTDFFMAPAHAYDGNTLRALKDTGFQRVTDGFGKRPYLWKGLMFYPISFRLSESLKKRHGFTTMVVHTNTMGEGDMERYRKIFREQEMISYGEYVEEPPARRTVFGRAGEYLLAAVKRFLVRAL